MEDKPDPPRRGFGFKPREFVRINRARGEPRQPDASADAGAQSFPYSGGPIDVRDFTQNASGDGSPLSTSSPAACEYDAQGILRLNLRNDLARGCYDVEPGKDRKRSRRIRNYVVALLAIDTPLGLIAWLSGHTDPFPFVCSIAAMAFLSAQITWETWFLRTD